MANFRYEALDSRGGAVTGVLDAGDEAAAATALREQGLFPTRLVHSGGASLAGVGDAAPSGPSGGLLPFWIRSGDVSLFFSQLALMLRNGLTLLAALETLGEVASKPGLRACARRLGQAVQEGRPLSQALADESVLPEIASRLAFTAEATGELDQAFDRAADLVERRAELRRQLISSLTYPVIVVVAALGVFVFLTTQVVPKFASFLAQRGSALPWSTQKLMDLSGFLLTYGHLVAGAGCLLFLALVGAWRTERGRRGLERALFLVPVLAGVLRSAAMAQLTRTLGLLLRSGLPLLESLAALSQTAAFRVYGDLLLQARERIVQGSSLARSLQDPLMPAVTLQVVAVGEETGSLDDVVSELADYYDRRLAQQLRTLASLVEPALLVVIGGMVGFVYMSFFQAVFSVAAR